MDNEGVDPVLGLGLSGDALIDWLAARIREIEKMTDRFPSIAVLVNREVDVGPLAAALNEALLENNISCPACPGVRSAGTTTTCASSTSITLKG